jgi:hypothetical protein
VSDEDDRLSFRQRDRLASFGPARPGHEELVLTGIDGQRDADAHATDGGAVETDATRRRFRGIQRDRHVPDPALEIGKTAAREGATLVMFGRAFEQFAQMEPRRGELSRLLLAQGQVQQRADGRVEAITLGKVVPSCTKIPLLHRVSAVAEKDLGGCGGRLGEGRLAHGPGDQANGEPGE